MDTNERLALIERVDHSSGEQAKRTLKFMILKCNVKQETIARAIRDAIERHAPTPTIVYEQPESEDDDEAAPTSSHKKSKKKNQDGSSQDEEDVAASTSKKRRSTRRGDINADPLVEQLILKKTKTKTNRNKKRSSDRNEEQNHPNSSKKNQSKHASKLIAEPEERTRDNSMGEPSQQKSPTVIDLLTSSEDETRDTQQSKIENLNDKSSDENSSDIDSPDDSSSHSDSSDDGGAEEEPQGNALADGLVPSQDASNKANQTSAGSSDGGRTTTRSSTCSKDKTPNQNNGIEISLLGLGKKRKASERTVEEVHNNQPAKSTMTAHLNKRSKQNHPQGYQRLLEDGRCLRCGILFPSAAQLLKHRDYCKVFVAKLGSHHRSEPPSDAHFRRLQHIQKASHPASESFDDEPHNTLRLPSRPRQREPAARESSPFPPSFEHEPNNFPRGTKGMNIAFTGHASDAKSPPPQDLAQTPGPDPSLDSPPDFQSRPPEPESLRQHLLKEASEQALRRCRLCKKWYRDSENVVGACSCHPGTCRSLDCQSRNKIVFS